LINPILMKNIEGYVFSVQNGGSELLFGRKVHPTRRKSFECFESNGLTPFQEMAEVVAAIEEHRGPSQADHTFPIYLVKMKIPNTDEEIKDFQEEPDLVVIRNGDDSLCRGLYGLKTNGSRSAHPLQAAYLCDNNYTTFSTKTVSHPYHCAQKVAAEINAQKRSHAIIGQFSREKL
jgi:hypothetical protein